MVAQTRLRGFPRCFGVRKRNPWAGRGRFVCVFFFKRIVPWEIIIFHHHLGIFLKLFFQTTDQANLNFCLEFVLWESHYVQSQNPEGQNGTRNGPISQLSEKLDIDNSLPPKIGRAPKGNELSSNHQFSRANC